MKLKILAPVLLSAFASSAFAHSYHDDEAPQPPLQQEATKPAKAPVAKPKAKHAHDHATAQDKAKSETPATQPAAGPKKTR